MALKKLAIFKSKREEPLKDEKSENEIRITYYQSGYGSSRSNGASPIVFKASLDQLYHEFERKCRQDEKEQKALKAPIEQEILEHQTALKKVETRKGLREENVENNKNRIREVKEEIADVKANPDKYGLDVDKKPKAQFYIGALVLIPITLYLFVFYVSASYSAFFKIFDPFEGVGQAIFDAQSLSKALNEGVAEFIFVFTIPFAFMGLGYLIHMFMKNKGVMSYIKVFLLFAVTFVFDAILAYQIDKKIYDLEKKRIDPDLTLSDAFVDPRFWGIIFAGFVVYIIWGLVFDFVMKEWDSIDKIKNFIRGKKEELKILEAENKKSEDNIGLDTEDIARISGLIKELNGKINSFVFPKRVYLTYHSEYRKAWYEALQKEIALPQKEKNIILENCETVHIAHLEKLGLSEDIDSIQFKPVKDYEEE